MEGLGGRRPDTREYPKGKQVCQAELDDVRLLLQEFHGEWNYVILPRAEWPDWPPRDEAVNT